jgi:long-chain acyl-CoA synthetase
VNDLESNEGAEFMTTTWQEAVEVLTASGGEFELTSEEVLGVQTRVFTRTPNSLRDLMAAAKLHGDAPYLVYEDERWSYADLTEQIDQLASALVLDFGVQPGDRVAIAMRNYPEWITAFGAIVSIGGVVVALNAWWLTDELAYGIDDSGSQLVICDDRRFELMGSLFEDRKLAAIVVRSDQELPEHASHYRSLLVDGATMPDVEIDTDDNATILYTSGTTGHPKGALSTHRAVLTGLLGFVCRAATSAMAHPPSAEDVAASERYSPCFILCVPLFHVTGLIPVMLGTFVSGARLVIMYKWDAARALELIEREQVTQFVGVPTMSWELLESPSFGEHDTSSLGSIGGGGAPAPPELVRRIEDNFERGRPSIGYGMTETNSLGPQNSGDDYLAKPTSAGRPPANMSIKIIDDEGNEVPTGERGEICFRGANLIRGYWNKPEATAETIQDGWLRSGDIGYVDEDGFVFVADRAKDMVIRAGENIYCAEVESAVYEHPSVFEAAVFGLPHERLGEEVAVAVMAKRDTSIDPGELQRFVAERVAKFKVPSHVFVFEEQLPRNASGKILKRDVRESVIASRDS